MRSRRPTSEHEEAVVRRLALLSAELAAVRRSRQHADGELDDRFDDLEETGHPPVPAASPWSDEHTHIRGGPAGEIPAVPVAPAEAPTFPVPGRHAVRRPPARSWLPSGLQGRVSLQPLHVTVVALVITCALGLTSWRLVRSAPEPLDVRTVGSDTSAASTWPGESTSIGRAPSGVADGAEEVDAGAAEGAPPGAAATGAEVTVDVAGKVRRPGIVVLPSGSRVVDAIEAAGGARPRVDLTPLNLARVLVDGEQVLVGVAAVPGTAAGATGAPPAGAGSLVNLNTADQTVLETLPGVGPVTAGAILAWRTEHGAFSSVDELLEVDGIGEATLEKLAPLVTI